ncbi:hypothetical protein CEXT_33801 [Caerostris extrusa]|uniref:Uncharacterized protein n=1 Tax=Caerostris extrusa TaxID=172846 RepID=A0AAV4UCQ8_CAEEX|nr:hypothetical protein CEXT_33801 [Caerostris extrusa]
MLIFQMHSTRLLLLSITFWIWKNGNLRHCVLSLFNLFPEICHYNIIIYTRQGLLFFYKHCKLPMLL